ncbi:MAG: insulinase family protein [Sinobacteraceae bacterium]|nr:insulinase family protein [Nevskiaceae bacterium]
MLPWPTTALAAGGGHGTQRPARSASTVPGADSVQAITLANGLRVIVWSDHDIPNVALYNWVRVGSRNEAPGITGLAHFFEHMMFNGTSRRAPGEFDRQMEAQGGANNAFTSDDVTVYQDWFPRSALELVFDLEADRLANLAFDPEVVESERGVVFSERRFSVEDNNPSFLFEQVQSTAFVAHPYQIPTIGWPSDIRAWKLEDLRAFFHTYYAPNNCTLVVVGDVTPEEVFGLARRWLEPIPRREPPPPVRTREPQQLGEKRVRVERKAQTPLLQVAYKAPAADDPSGPALNLLLSVLGEGDSSRLHRELVETQKLAIDVRAIWNESLDPGLAWFMLALPEGGDPAALEQALDAQLQRVVAEGVTAAELQRAKNLAAAAFWNSLATIDGKARLLGEYEVMQGGWQKLFDAPVTYEAVTREQVQAAARELLQVRRRTVGVLQPRLSSPTPDGAADPEPTEESP